MSDLPYDQQNEHQCVFGLRLDEENQGQPLGHGQPPCRTNATIVLNLGAEHDLIPEIACYEHMAVAHQMHKHMVGAIRELNIPGVTL